MDEQHEYTPGQLLEIEYSAQHWSGKGRAYLGTRLDGRIAYEWDGTMYSEQPRRVRPAPVTHEITLTLTDEQVKALGEVDFQGTSAHTQPRFRGFQALVDAAREVLA